MPLHEYRTGKVFFFFHRLKKKECRLIHWTLLARLARNELAGQNLKIVLHGTFATGMFHIGQVPQKNA